LANRQEAVSCRLQLAAPAGCDAGARRED